MLNKINNLEELVQEKARLRAQLTIVQAELNASAMRTRQEFKTLLEEKLSLSKQLGQLFQGNARPAAAAGTAAVRTISQAVGGGTWWGGLLATFAPMLVDLVRRQLERRKERRKNAKTETDENAPKPKPKSRRIFKRKASKPAEE